MNFLYRNIIVLLSMLITPMLFISCQNDPDTGGKSQRTSPAEHRKSPIAIASAQHMDTYIKIVYGQPYMRGREIFGELVPYGEVWRLGANEATEMTVTRPIIFGGKKLESGTYTLFAIPNEDNWQIIINTKLGQWGAFDYDKSFDLMRIKVPVSTLKKPVEALTITFPEEIDSKETQLTIAWEYTQVKIPVTFSPNT